MIHSSFMNTMKVYGLGGNGGYDAYQCAPANPALALRLRSTRPVGRVPGFGLLGPWLLTHVVLSEVVVWMADLRSRCILNLHLE